MPVYNGEKYLKESVNSILNQIYTDFELVIVDDGSEDKTLDILKKYRDNRIQIFSRKHAGEVSARNFAVQHTNQNSKYLLNHDCDDISLPAKLFRLVSYLEQNPKVSVIGCFAQYFDCNNHNIGSPKIEFEPDRIRRTFGKRNSMINSASLIRRKVFNRIGCYREQYRRGEDYDFFARALMSGFVLANIPEVLHLIRLHPESVGEKYKQDVEVIVSKIQREYKLE